MKNHQKHQNYKIYKIKSYKPQETFQNKWDLILNSELKVKKTFRKQQKLLNKCLNGGICPKSGIGHGHNLKLPYNNNEVLVPKIFSVNYEFSIVQSATCIFP